MFTIADLEEMCALLQRAVTGGARTAAELSQGRMSRLTKRQEEEHDCTGEDERPTSLIYPLGGILLWERKLFCKPPTSQDSSKQVICWEILAILVEHSAVHWKDIKLLSSAARMFQVDSPIGFWGLGIFTLDSVSRLAEFSEAFCLLLVWASRTAVKHTVSFEQVSALSRSCWERWSGVQLSSEYDEDICGGWESTHLIVSCQSHYQEAHCLDDVWAMKWVAVTFLEADIRRLLWDFIFLLDDSEPPVTCNAQRVETLRPAVIVWAISCPCASTSDLMLFSSRKYKDFHGQSKLAGGVCAYQPWTQQWLPWICRAVIIQKEEGHSCRSPLPRFPQSASRRKTFQLFWTTHLAELTSAHEYDQSSLISHCLQQNSLCLQARVLTCTAESLSRCQGSPDDMLCCCCAPIPADKEHFTYPSMTAIVQTSHHMLQFAWKSACMLQGKLQVCFENDDIWHKISKLVDDYLWHLTRFKSSLMGYYCSACRNELYESWHGYLTRRCGYSLVQMTVSPFLFCIRTSCSWLVCCKDMACGKINYSEGSNCHISAIEQARPEHSLDLPVCCLKLEA